MVSQVPLFLVIAESLLASFAASFALCVWKYATKPTTTETRSASAERMLSASIPAMIWPQFTILPSSVICDGWFLCDSQLTQPGEGTFFQPFDRWRFCR